MVHLSEQFTPENSSHPSISWSQLLKKFIYVAPMATLFFPPHMQLISSMECYHFWMFPFFFKVPPPRQNVICALLHHKQKTHFDNYTDPIAQQYNTQEHRFSTLPISTTLW